MADSKPSDETARSAGRGGLAIATAKIYFILTGLVQQIALPRVLGLSGYGALSSVLSIAGIAYNPIVSASIQGVSRAVAGAPPDEQPAAVRRVLSVHAALTVPMAVGFFLLAPVIGRNIGAPHVVASLQIISGVLFFYGLYAPLVGVLNGTKRFFHQAGLDMTFATVRTCAVIVGGWWLAGSDRGPEGATVGFVGATSVIFVLALAVVGIGKRGSGGQSAGAYLGYIAPLALSWVLQNLLLQADITMLRRFAADAAERASLPYTAADPLVGAYRATQLFSFLPYQLLLAVTFILFPMLATAQRDGDRAAVARYVRMGVRLALVLMGVMVSVTSGLSRGLMLIVFPKEAADLGAGSMEILSLGFGAFAIFGILTTVLNSLGRERASAAITAVAFAAVVALCWIRVPGAPLGDDLLWRTATSTSAGLVIATVLAAVLVKRTAHAVVAPMSVVRVVLSMAAAIAVGRALPDAGKVVTLAWVIVVALVYMVVLVALREIGRADLDLVKTVLRRKA